MDKFKSENYADNKIKRLVFVGSLGYKNMYLQEVLDWLAPKREEFKLDIYSYNIDAKAKQTLQECNLPNVKYHGGCNYDDLPTILKIMILAWLFINHFLRIPFMQFQIKYLNTWLVGLMFGFQMI